MLYVLTCIALPILTRAQTLYPVDQSAVVDLTPQTFSASVYNGSSMAGHLVEFYLHTCGHCRAFAPTYELLARETTNWKSFAQVTAINCAVQANQAICRENDVPYTPYLKYFPSTATANVDGIVVDAYRTTNRLKDAFLEQILQDQKTNGIADASWPIFDYIPDNETLYRLWQVTPSSQLGIVFDADNESYTAAEVIANHFITAKANKMTLRRARPTSNLIDSLEIRNLPALATFSRAQLGQPIYISDQTNLLGNMLLQQLGQVTVTTTEATPSTTEALRFQNPALTDPQRWYASEADILMATRKALLDEVVTFHDVIDGQLFDSMLIFIQMLRKYFMASDSIDQAAGKLGFNPPNLTRSRQARFVFDDLEQMMMRRQNRSLTVEEWEKNFRKFERNHAFPFTASLDGWQHCAGSSEKYRGYTCGLWTLFHMLTVQSYIAEAGKNNTSDASLGRELLQGIQGWVENYFSCKHCSQHFMNMTTNALPIDDMVSKPSDTVLYLWRAHNMVNQRLSGDTTDDPMFPKRQFPMTFLCEDCKEEIRNQAAWDIEEVLEYLLDYYTNVRVSPRPLYILPLENKQLPPNSELLSAGPLSVVEVQ